MEYSQHIDERRRNRLGDPGQSTGRALVDAVLAGGRQASGRSVGAIAIGNRADFLVLDDAHPSLDCREGDAVLDGWIFAAAGSPIRDVWISGVHVVREGRHMAREAAVTGFKAAMLACSRDADRKRRFSTADGIAQSLRRTSRSDN